MSSPEHHIVPDWPAPARVRALQTTRQGGVSHAPYDSLNLGDHVGDVAHAVAHNRQLLSALMPSEPVWLQQVHGTEVVNAATANCLPQADACITSHRGAVCAVMTADCLPVLLCDEDGRVVAAAHAGWKGLAAGVLESTVKAMDVAPHKLLAWFGPAISQRAFEVGDEVREIFMAHDVDAASAFQRGAQGKWMADIFMLARQRLHACGVTRIYGGELCTHGDPARFFSYRRDGVTGRMGTFIWLE